MKREINLLMGLLVAAVLAFGPPAVADERVIAEKKVQDKGLVRNISWAAIATADLGRAVAFYRDVLELDLERFDAKALSASFRLPSGQLLELFDRSREDAAGLNSPIIGLGVDGADAAARRAGEAGARILGRHKPGQVKWVGFEDAEGYPYAFVEAIPRIRRPYSFGTKKIRIGRIVWVGREVSDLKRGASFWNRVLGIEHWETRPPFWGVPKEQLKEVEALPIIFWTLPEEDQFELVPNGFFTGKKGVVHPVIGFTLTPEDYDVAVEKLKERSVRFASADFDFYNLSWTMFHDPDGYVIELYTMRNQVE